MPLPRAGWLYKLRALPFGRCSRQKKYFVLLETELRCYKNEHSVMPAHTLNLREVSRVIRAAAPGNPFCLRFELIMAQKTLKVWTLACESRVERETWLSAIQLRLDQWAAPTDASSMCSPTTSLIRPPLSVARPLKPYPSLSRRRGIILSPIDVVSYFPSLAESSVDSSTESSLSADTTRSDSMELDTVPLVAGKTNFSLPLFSHLTPKMCTQIL